MRFMVIFKANADSEKGALPDPQAIAEMNKFTDELVEAGVVLGYEGLHPSSKGARVHFSGKNRIVTEGHGSASARFPSGGRSFSSCLVRRPLKTWPTLVPDGFFDRHNP